jgi:hypothetical protein
MMHNITIINKLYTQLYSLVIQNLLERNWLVSSLASKTETVRHWNEGTTMAGTRKPSIFLQRCKVLSKDQSAPPTHLSISLVL